ncbi:hypothetical protein CEXT_279421 [Caerostris extrusa]|uniref:Uncharacterized protein n=1 Tax=Caerostris extrusa TaxID=172846 RepID=A0AAV4XIH8_CAEEX|nr:hypothetical protein CEXT_279421 [Caerostris extrusa]
MHKENKCGIEGMHIKPEVPILQSNVTGAEIEWNVNIISYPNETVEKQFFSIYFLSFVTAIRYKNRIQTRQQNVRQQKDTNKKRYNEKKYDKKIDEIEIFPVGDFSGNKREMPGE